VAAARIPRASSLVLMAAVPPVPSAIECRIACGARTLCCWMACAAPPRSSRIGARERAGTASLTRPRASTV
jgi:hypothetical protein